MIARDLIPSVLLREYIQRYRLRHFIFSNGFIPPVKPYPPRPEQSLTFYIRGSETTRYLHNGKEIKKPRAVISGQFTGRVDRFVSNPEILMIMVDFKPGALHRLTGIPFTEFTNQDMDAETIFSSDFKTLNDRLGSEESYSGMISMIDNFLSKLLQQCTREIQPVDRVLEMAAKEPAKSVDWFAQQAYLSTRQLERKFNERIGISPKTFLRISRFNQSYWSHLKNRKLSWFDIAMDCEYTDYQHLVKDYLQFASANPTQFFAEESTAPGRVLGLTK
ncbi:MAG: helix-turn-helix domain-containing protein [Flavisolibacter sp.]